MVLSFLGAGRTPVRSRVFRDLTYRSDPSRQLDVHAPLGADGEAPVVVVLPPATRGGRVGRRPLAASKALAARGLVVLAPAFDEGSDLVQRLEDAAWACAWAQGHAAGYGGDPRCVFVLGEADGACAAAMLALDPHWLSAAGAEGPLRGVVGVSGLYDLEPPEAHTLAHTRAEAPPMLLIAGAEGPSGCCTGRLARARRSVGGPVAEIRYPGLDARSGLRGLAGALSSRATPLEEVERFIRLGSLRPAA